MEEEEPPSTHIQHVVDRLSDEELVRKTAIRMRVCPDERWRRFRELQKKFAASAELWRKQSNVEYKGGQP